MGATAVRRAARAVMWRRLSKQEFPSRIVKVKLEDIPFFDDCVVNPVGMVTILCGPNGVGKTSILRLLRNTVGGLGSTGLPTTLLEAGVGRCEVELKVASEPVRMVMDLAELKRESSPVQSAYLDPFTACSAQLNAITGTSNFHELLEAAGEREANPQDLETLAYVLRRTYDHVTTYEIDDFPQDDDVFPYFQVSMGGVAYGSENMGLGELAVHYLLWELQRAAEGSFIFVEEPESFVAPFSQIALLDVFGQASAARHISIVTTTHAPSILSAVPLENTHLLHYSSGSFSVSSEVRESDIYRALGVEVPLRGIAIVEDQVSQEFTIRLLDELRFELLREIDVCVGGDVGKVVQAVNAIPTDLRRVAVVGILDADQNEPTGTAWPVICLPGTESPEACMRSAATSDAMSLAELLGRDPLEVSAALANCEGKENHDWLLELAREFSLSRTQLIAPLVKLLMMDAGFEASAVAFAKRLHEHLRAGDE